MGRFGLRLMIQGVTRGPRTPEIQYTWGALKISRACVTSALRRPILVELHVAVLEIGDDDDEQVPKVRRFSFGPRLPCDRACQRLSMRQLQV